MSISLTKNQAISLTKAAPSVSRFYIACGWGEQQGVDIDVSAFVCRIEQDGSPYLFAGPDPYSNLCFFNNIRTPDGAVTHSGDNLCGKNNPQTSGTPAEFDDESITVSINDLPSEVDEIAILLTIHDAKARGQSFGRVRDCFVRITENDAAGREIASYKPTEDFRDHTSVMIGSLMKRNGGWEFEAVGQGYVASFEQVVGQFVKP